MATWFLKALGIATYRSIAVFVLSVATLAFGLAITVGFLQMYFVVEDHATKFDSWEVGVCKALTILICSVVLLLTVIRSIRPLVLFIRKRTRISFAAVCAFVVSFAATILTAYAASVQSGVAVQMLLLLITMLFGTVAVVALTYAHMSQGALV